jgi:type IV secretion system protein VirB10
MEGVPGAAAGQSAAIAGGPDDDDPNYQGRKNAFLTSRRAASNTLTYEPLQDPSRTVRRGTIIPAVLVTAINSDLPGVVLARVRENVCDGVTGRNLLIPQGSTLIADYDSKVAWGQERVLLCWHRLELPNGDSVDLQCMPGADLAGRAGLTDDVDHHWWRIIKGAVLSSLLSASITAASGDVESYHPTVPQQFARGAATDIAQAGQAVTRRNLNVQPTITVRAGWAMNVMVTQPMQLRPYPAAGCSRRPRGTRHEEAP